MRYFLPLILLACGPEVPYSPEEQDFDDFESWGDGIPGFEIGQSGPVDTGGGSGGPCDTTDLNGVYLGTYSVLIVRDNDGVTCAGSSSLTMAVSESCDLGPTYQTEVDCTSAIDPNTSLPGVWASRITIGQGQQVSLDCGGTLNLTFDGVFDSTGMVTGMVSESSSNTFGATATWTGVASAGTLVGSFSEYVSSNQGMINFSGDVNVAKQ